MVKACVIVGVTVAIFCSLVAGLSCDQARENLIENGTYVPGKVHLPCINPCDDAGNVISNRSECLNAKFCHWNGSSCFLKTVNVTTVENATNLGDILSRRLVTDARTATVPGFPFPVIPPWCVRFPATCNIEPHDPNNIKLLDPPVNIPYCQRTACPGNPSLELDGVACHSVPGCYFDVELFNLRYYFGHSFMPGVPTCHMAVRNRKFHQLVNEYTQNGTIPWNGLHTYCFIEENKESIFQPSAGCSKIDALVYMGVQPKLAGWKDITERECKLIGGCFTHDCFLPLKEKGIQIPEGSDIHASLPDATSQRCQALDVSFTPSHFLTAHHQCKQSGCVVIPSVDIIIRQHLLNVTLTYLPPYLRLLFWYLVQVKQVGVDNWREKVDEVMAHPDNFAEIYRSVDWMTFRNRLSRIMNKAEDTKSPDTFTNQERFILMHPEAAGTVLPDSSPSLPDTAFPGPLPITTGLIEPFCPYHLYEFNGLLPLKGSFSGCCDQNLCYRPRYAVSEEFSGVAAYWAQWGSWGQCSHTCGHGVRVATRRCVRFRHSDNCEGEEKRELYCSLEPCPQWAAWGAWSSCSESCDGGLMRRNRECTGEGCRGDSTESRECATVPCPVFGDWSAWSKCNASCSAGLQDRNRSCEDSITTLACPPADGLSESRICHSYCGKVVQVSKSKCRKYPSCAIVRKYECLMKTPRGNKKGHCKDFKKVKKQRCYQSFQCRFCRWFHNCDKVDM